MGHSGNKICFDPVGTFGLIQGFLQLLSLLLVFMADCIDITGKNHNPEIVLILRYQLNQIGIPVAFSVRLLSLIFKIYLFFFFQQVFLQRIHRHVFQVLFPAILTYLSFRNFLHQFPVAFVHQDFGQAGIFITEIINISAHQVCFINIIIHVPDTDGKPFADFHLLKHSVANLFFHGLALINIPGQGNLHDILTVRILNPDYMGICPVITTVISPLKMFHVYGPFSLSKQFQKAASAEIFHKSFFIVRMHGGGADFNQTVKGPGYGSIMADKPGIFHHKIGILSKIHRNYHGINLRHGNLHLLSAQLFLLVQLFYHMIADGYQAGGNLIIPHNLCGRHIHKFSKRHIITGHGTAFPVSDETSGTVSAAAVPYLFADIAQLYKRPDFPEPVIYI